MWRNPFGKLSHRRRGVLRQCPRRSRPASARLTLEALEDRSLLSGGLSESLVALGGATPRPIQFPLALAANPFGGPDIYGNFVGPADVPPVFGNEPNGITDFTGFVGAVRVQGNGQDDSGNRLFWDADLRFIQGNYRGLDGNLYRHTFVEV